MADNIDDGGPAFPHLRPLARWTDDGPEMVKENMGMSLRDWFAGQVMAGLAEKFLVLGLDEVDIARGCFKYADEMLKAREAR